MDQVRQAVKDVRQALDAGLDDGVTTLSALAKTAVSEARSVYDHQGTKAQVELLTTNIFACGLINQTGRPRLRYFWGLRAAFELHSLSHSNHTVSRGSVPDAIPAWLRGDKIFFLVQKVIELRQAQLQSTEEALFAKLHGTYPLVLYCLLRVSWLTELVVDTRLPQKIIPKLKGISFSRVLRLHVAAVSIYRKIGCAGVLGTNCFKSLETPDICTCVVVPNVFAEGVDVVLAYPTESTVLGVSAALILLPGCPCLLRCVRALGIVCLAENRVLVRLGEGSCQL
jgi:hypothetical protein